MSSSKRRRVPKYCLHKARGLARVTIDGKDHYLGRYGSPESKERYRELVGQWLDSQHDDLLDTRTDIRLCELMVAYLRYCSDYYQKNGRPTREYGCISEALRQVRRQFDLVKVDSFGPKSLKAIRESMVDQGWSRRYINKQIGRIVRMFKWGVQEQLVRSSTWQALQSVDGLRKGRTAAIEHEPVMAVKDAVVEATLPELPPTVADMVRFQRLTGCRPTEVCLLRPIDVDRSGDVWTYRPESHKTEHHGKARVIHIGPLAQGILMPYLLRLSSPIASTHGIHPRPAATPVSGIPRTPMVERCAGRQNAPELKRGAPIDLDTLRPRRSDGSSDWKPRKSRLAMRRLMSPRYTRSATTTWQCRSRGNLGRITV